MKRKTSALEKEVARILERFVVEVTDALRGGSPKGRVNIADELETAAEMGRGKKR